METEISLRCLRGPATCSYPEAHNSTPRRPILRNLNEIATKYKMSRYKYFRHNLCAVINY
jgi:hypothetical protein